MIIPVPLRITLYDPETNEARRTYTVCNVRWRSFKTAMGLAELLNFTDADALLKDDSDSIANLVVDIFGGQFTLDELLEGSNLSEMRSLVQVVVNRMSLGVPAKQSHPDDAEKREIVTEADDSWIINLEESLVRMFGWNLKDIDETYVETLLPFVRKLISDEQDQNDQPDKKRAFCDQVSWL